MKPCNYYDVVDSFQPSPGHLYRGVGAEELAFIRRTGRIESDQRYCVPGEGTCFAPSFADAVSYATYGRDNPCVTGQPVYVIEIRLAAIPRARDGYYKVPSVPASEITRIWEFRPDGTAHLYRR